MINLMRNLGGSVGVSFTTTMLEQRLQFHHERLAEHITAYNGYAWNTPLLPIDTVIQAQAGIISYLDIPWMLGMLGLCVWPIALFLPRMPKGAGALASRWSSPRCAAFATVATQGLRQRNP